MVHVNIVNVAVMCMMEVAKTGQQIASLHINRTNRVGCMDSVMTGTTLVNHLHLIG